MQMLVVKPHLAGVIALFVEVVGKPHLLAVKVSQPEESRRQSAATVCATLPLGKVLPF